MIASGEYLGRLLIREILIDSPGSSVRDFKGNTQTSRAFAIGYKIQLTPTLLFLDPDGNELAERIVGIQTPELFYFMWIALFRMLSQPFQAEVNLFTDWL